MGAISPLSLLIIVIVSLLAVGVAAIWIRAVFLRTDNMQDSELGAASSTSGSTAGVASAPPESTAVWPGKTTKIVCALCAYFCTLLLIWIFSSNLSVIHLGFATSSYSDFLLGNFVEIAMVAIVVFWIALSVSNSFVTLILRVVTFGLLLFSMLALVLNQSRSMFWLAFCVLIFIGLQEVYDQFRSRSLLKGGAQVILIFLLWLTLLHWLTEYFLGLPKDLFAIVISYASRVRLILLTFLGSIVVLATIASVLPKFSWPYRHFLREIEGPGWRSIFLQPIIITINVLLNFLLNASSVLIEAVIDAARFIREVFFDRDLWRTVFNIGFIGLWSFLIAFLTVSARPYLIKILQSPSLLTALRDGFDSKLALANLLVGGAFLLGFGAVLGLARAWLSGRPKEKSSATKGITDAAVVIYVCIWAATLTYFYPINLVFGLHSGLWAPGIYTLLVIPMALAGLLFRSRPAEEIRRSSSTDITGGGVNDADGEAQAGHRQGDTRRGVHAAVGPDAGGIG
jgi:hypothetical protein